MKTELIKQIENDLLNTIQSGLRSQKAENDQVSGLILFNHVTDSIQTYKENLLANKADLKITEEELEEVIEKASANVIEKLFEG